MMTVSVSLPAGLTAAVRCMSQVCLLPSRRYGSTGGSWGPASHLKGSRASRVTIQGLTCVAWGWEVVVGWACVLVVGGGGWW